MMLRSSIALLLLTVGADAFQTAAPFGRMAPSLVNNNKASTMPLFTVSDVLPPAMGGTETKKMYADVALTSAAAPSYSMLETPPDAFEIMAKKGAIHGDMGALKTVISAMIGGAYVGMGGMLSLAVSGNMASVAGSNPGLAKFMFAVLFPVNLLLCVQAGGQLFTGNTAYLTAGVLEGKTTIKKLLRSWGLSFLGNLIACAGFAGLCRYSGVLAGGAGELAAKTLIAKTSVPLGPIMVRAFLCNWLVCLAVYLSMQAKDMTGKYISILLPISTFVAIGFEHSVANMFLLPAGLLCSTAATGVSLSTAICKNLIPVAIGNAIGGSLMVGALMSYMFGKLGHKDEK